MVGLIILIIRTISRGYIEPKFILDMNRAICKHKHFHIHRRKKWRCRNFCTPGPIIAMNFLRFQTNLFCNRSFSTKTHRKMSENSLFRHDFNGKKWFRKRSLKSRAQSTHKKAGWLKNWFFCYCCCSCAHTPTHIGLMHV